MSNLFSKSASLGRGKTERDPSDSIAYDRDSPLVAIKILGHGLHSEGTRTLHVIASCEIQYWRLKCFDRCQDADYRKHPYAGQVISGSAVTGDFCSQAFRSETCEIMSAILRAPTADDHRDLFGEQTAWFDSARGPGRSHKILHDFANSTSGRDTWEKPAKGITEKDASAEVG